MSRISQQQLESYLWGAATLLRGTIDAGDYKQFIFPLLFYKRICDVFDEETAVALKESGGDKTFAAYRENHRFQVPPEAHWFQVRQTSTNVGLALQSGMRAIETANPEKLYGIFGDAQWTNKDRLSDLMLRDLVEHFSSLELTLTNLPEDELGQGYEYLIKKFADDAGHTAAEFYTNRTVVHLMTQMLEPQPGESIYDPTCGSGGMLLSCITQLRREGKEWRNVRLYGQERNLMTSSIARMNFFLHGIEDFEIVRGDTLSEPKFVQGDRLKRFDVVLANPPYSIKQWDRDAFASDPWGRNLYGTPPQGRADYAFWQHILCSLAAKKGRCAILFPHGVLFRQEEADMRRKIIEADVIECVIGLGPNLFYNAAMEACVVICRAAKSRARKGRIFFINAVNEVTRERAQSFLTGDHIEHIVTVYRSFKSEAGFAKGSSLEEVRENDYSLKIDLYVSTPSTNNGNTGTEQQSELPAAVASWSEFRVRVRDTLSLLLPDLKRVAPKPDKSRLTPLTEIRRRFNRSKWTRVRFGDVVNLLKDSVDPNSGELDRYIAGDHMDSENVHLRRWGLVGDGYLGPAFIRRFQKGQVLYGSRRTYLKKVAYAEFDGITANTTFVLEGVEGRLYQPLLPWLMLSRKFTEHSVRESKGSTNPYINFPDIAEFEFDLPSLDQQRGIADILWAADNLANEYDKLAASCTEAYDSVLLEPSREGPKRVSGRLEEFVEFITDGDHNPPSRRSTGIPHLVVRNVEGGRLNLDDCTYISKTDFERVKKRYNPRQGDIVLTCVGTIGRIAIVPRDFVFSADRSLALIRPYFQKMTAEFAKTLLESAAVQIQMRASAIGTAQKHLYLKDIRQLFVTVPDLKTQARILSDLKPIRYLRETAMQAADAAKRLAADLLDALYANSNV